MPPDFTDVTKARARLLVSVAIAVAAPGGARAVEIKVFSDSPLGPARAMTSASGRSR
jgi:hypothetical protein